MKTTGASECLNVVVEGFNITIGTFFGHRRYSRDAGRPRGGGWGVERAGESDVDAFTASATERDVSILDDPAFDAIEVVYAGKFFGR